MTAIKYFNGQTELTDPHGMQNTKFAAFGVKGIWYDSFSRFVGRTADGRILPVERRVQYKTNNPSKHLCDARCLNATGKIMNCECSCGGKNHGAGSFNCIAA